MPTSASPLITDLPIIQVLPDICHALTQHPRCLLVAQPGAGKTTRVPLALLAHFPASLGRWLLLEPRRVAARLAATYMAASLGESVGKTVGYRVRGESRVGASTRLEVVTQGILTRMLQDDPALEGVAGIIFDEFHERSLDADLGLTLSLDVQRGLRDDLRLLVMSATLDVPSLLTVMGSETPVIECPGRVWPIHTCYRAKPLRVDDAEHQTNVVLEALARDDGQVLVFLPGQREIRRLSALLQTRLPGNCALYELHGQLTLAQQQAVLAEDDAGQRRVILSTSIAESSLTVPGVRIVVDAGFERVPVFRPRTGMSALETRRVNRASADQRRGRAGRVAPGTCYRLWSEDAMLGAHREPEIVQSDLAGLAFELLRWGVNDPSTLSWVTPPPRPAFEAAHNLLAQLGLCTAQGKLTDKGRRCARWPTHPRLAVLIDRAMQVHALPLACGLVALLEDSAQPVDLDLGTVLQHLMDRTTGTRGKPWVASAAQWAQRLGCSPMPDSLNAVPALLLAAFPDRVAQNLRQQNDQHQARFKLVGGGQALLDARHPLAQAEFLVAVSLDGDTSGARLFQAYRVSQADVEASFPETATWQARIHWDSDLGRVVGEEQRRLGSLVLASRPLKQLPPEAIRLGLLEALRQRGFLWRDECRHLLGRLRLLHRHLGSPWPSSSDEELLATLEHWLAPRLDGVSSLAQLDRLPLGRFWLESLEWSLQPLFDSLAPSHLTVPSGSRIAVDYTGEEPVLAVKLQELFGLTETPTLLQGRLPVLLHLLSPARRPVQVTRDLAGFWATGYFEVRKDLKGRYPRHPWPDDPLQAPATARAKKKGT